MGLPHHIGRGQRKADSRAKKARMERGTGSSSLERQLVRDYVDTRWTISEFMLPVMILIMAASMALMGANPTLATYVSAALWPLMLMAIINVDHVARLQASARRAPSGRPLHFALMSWPAVHDDPPLPPARPPNQARGPDLMSYRWEPDGGLEKRFEDQSLAEEWLSSFFDELIELGVTEVTLYEEDRLVYGPMSLLP